MRLARLQYGSELLEQSSDGSLKKINKHEM